MRPSIPGLGTVVIAACVSSSDDVRPTSERTAVAPDSANAEACQVANAAPQTWTCVITTDLVVTVTLTADSTARAGDRSLRVVPVRGNLQPVTIRPEDTFGFSSETVTAADLDGDGRRELMIRRDIGHPNNIGYDIWYYEPARHMLLLDSLMSSETNVAADSVGCVRTQGWLGGNDIIERRYCHTGGRRWVVTWERREEPDST